MSEGDGKNGSNGAAAGKSSPPPLVRKMRSHTRHALEVAVTILSDAPGGFPPSRTSGHILFDTRDLSTGGAFLKSASLLEIGEEIGLEFRIGGGKAVRARCKVVRVERKPPTGMGISFTKLDPSDQAALKAFVASKP
jgi:hypothetical protein